MKPTFDPALDGRVFPTTPGASPTTVGETYVGPQALLSHLETALGLTQPQFSNTERATALIPALKTTPGYWSRSFEADAFATARRLLQDRDHLYLHGWQGENASPRLGQLATATATITPGIPDRLAAITNILKTRNARIETINLLEPRTHLPPTWQSVLGALETNGTTIHQLPSPDPHATGDLAGAQANNLDPTGDNTLQLIRPYGPAESAEAVAAALSRQSTLERTVVINPDLVLDHALAEHGLPTTGADSPGHHAAAILPLVLELAWSPQDPQQAYELLLVPDGPVRRSVGARLVDALQRWPSTRSDRWKRKLQGALERIEDASDRDRLATRIEAIFTANVERRQGNYPIDEVHRRTTLIRNWAQARTNANDTTPHLRPVVHQCNRLLQLLELANATSLTATELRRWTRLATDETRFRAPHDAQAGLAAVDRPDAIVGTAGTIIWWNFHLGAAPHPERSPWSRAETEALAKIGVHLPDPATEALNIAERWRRPLIHAGERLLLVCPQRGSDGEALHPHPLWDEVECSIPEEHRMSTRHLLRRQYPEMTHPVERTPVAQLLLPKPRREFTAGAIVQREKESPSSVENLLGCSMKWTLDYPGKLERGLAEAPSVPDNRLLGSLTHEVLHRLVQTPGLDATNAAGHAEQLFDRVIADMAQPLLLPGAEAIRGEARHRIARAAHALVNTMERGGLRVAATEEQLSVDALGTALAGRPDLVLQPAAIVDYKWGSRVRHREALSGGTALQLAAYAYMVAESKSSLPTVAYMIVRSQDILTTSPELFPGSVFVPGYRTEDVWSAVEVAYRERRAELHAGKVQAPGNPDADGSVHPERAGIDGGKLVLMPGCRFCDYSALCGMFFGADA